MKIEYTEGCVVYDLNVDGEPFSSLDHDKKIEVFDRIFEYLAEEYGFNTMLADILQRYGEYNHCYTCQDCGDSVCTYTIDV